MWKVQVTQRAASRAAGSLPEGAPRGHDFDEAVCLYPAQGGGHGRPGYGVLGGERGDRGQAAVMRPLAGSQPRAQRCLYPLAGQFASPVSRWHPVMMSNTV
jgi:hypothetical protein